MCCASMAVHLRANRSLPWCVVGGTWRIGSSSLRLELPNGGLHYQDCGFEQRFSESVQPLIPQHQTTDMSHMTHTLLPSLAGRRFASCPSCASCASAATQFRRSSHSVCYCGAITCVLDGTCAQPYTRASCVVPDDTELHWLARVCCALPCKAPFLRTVYSGMLPIVQVSRQTQRPITTCRERLENHKTPLNWSKNRTFHLGETWRPR